MKRSNRLLWLGALALGVIFLLTLIAAPSTNQLNTGSTYSRAPDGYGAWYAFMQDDGSSIQRWQKPFSDLPEKSPTTLLRVNSQPSQPKLAQAERVWVEKGNTLVILGVLARPTEAAFSTMQLSSAGSVKIDTRRRQQEVEKQLLGDRFGTLVWQEKLGEGKVIFSTTPYLAANAYQDYPNNFIYLASITGNKTPVWVDEYIHGYKDADVRAREDVGDLVTYLIQKPVFPLLLQAVVLLLVLIWAQNRRFGQPAVLDTQVVDNSQAYIQALAGVLQKAESREFVVDIVGKAEQLQLQKALGLGQFPLDRQTLVNAWVQQTGRSASELKQLQLQSQKRRISDKDLLTWLGKWQLIRGHVKDKP